MAGSTFGTAFRLTTFGESHGGGLGVIVDGCPSGLFLTEEMVQEYLDRRAPGKRSFATTRKEGDRVRILSGVFEGRTEGTPVAMLVENTDARSGDYSALAHVFRPGHADYTYTEKYGFRDYRGGGRSSGRETLGRVAGGAVAACFLKELGITVTAYTLSIGEVKCDPASFDMAERDRNDLAMPDKGAAAKAGEYLKALQEKGDSAGGIIECVIRSLPAGLGEPVFDKLDAELSKAMLSIGAVKGFEAGDGFRAAENTGSANNDGFYISEGQVKKSTNHSGGVLGGISDGSEVIFRVAVKPTPSVSLPQKTVNDEGEETELIIGGRHDSVIVPRAVVVAECMAAAVTADMLLRNMGARLKDIRRFYGC
ncbi:MAG: chorismate synthase [Lachnospiraceae bacterium]|nr:chorismate synthase [Lachnospiraceae bacterium]